MKIQLSHSFNDIISIDNLLLAWQEFIKGKRKRKDVQEFAFGLMDNIFPLHSDLANLTYTHGGYQTFNISDPKPRNIHKATVRDQFIKHKLKAKHYIRYADDFVVLSENKEWLENLIKPIRDFLARKLKLTLHPDKVFIKTLASGVDFLGWTHFPDHRVLRTATRRRMVRRMKENPTQEVVSSYFGLIQYGNTQRLKNYILCQIRGL